MKNKFEEINQNIKESTIEVNEASNNSAVLIFNKLANKLVSKRSSRISQKHKNYRHLPDNILKYFE